MSESYDQEMEDYHSARKQTIKKCHDRVNEPVIIVTLFICIILIILGVIGVLNLVTAIFSTLGLLIGGILFLPAFLCRYVRA